MLQLSTNHAEAIGYASHSHETISLPQSKPHSLYNSCLENHLTVRIQNNTNLQQIILLSSSSHFVYEEVFLGLDC
jgi:hypothetical protein